MNKIIVLIGDSGVGKDYILSIVSRYKDIEVIKRSLSRAPRESEKDSISAIFNVDIDEIKKMDYYYEGVQPGCFYGLNKIDLVNALKKNKSPIVIFPNYESFLKIYDDFNGNVVPFFIYGGYNDKELELWKKALLERGSSLEEIELRKSSINKYFKELYIEHYELFGENVILNIKDLTTENDIMLEIEGLCKKNDIGIDCVALKQLKRKKRKPLYVQNLAMIITNKCNLNCEHCLRGDKNSLDMNEDVIIATLSQIDAIGNLCICGGEPPLALESLEKIFNYIIDNHIIVDQVTTVINGTIYSEKFLELLKKINEYLKSVSRLRKNRVTFTISYDKYHIKEMIKLGLKEEYINNVDKYSQSEFFYGLQGLHYKLFREGNAENLNPELTVSYKPIGTIMTYVGKYKMLDKENGICNIGPSVTVNVNGTITECDVSIEHQETLYNYGNVLDDLIIDVFSDKAEILKPRKWYKETGKLIKRYKKDN